MKEIKGVFEKKWLRHKKRKGKKRKEKEKKMQTKTKQNKQKSGNIANEKKKPKTEYTPIAMSLEDDEEEDEEEESEANDAYDEGRQHRLFLHLNRPKHTKKHTKTTQYSSSKASTCVYFKCHSHYAISLSTFLLSRVASKKQFQFKSSPPPPQILHKAEAEPMENLGT